MKLHLLVPENSHVKTEPDWTENTKWCT